jgi:hypothetical protein
MTRTTSFTSYLQSGGLGRAVLLSLALLPMTGHAEEAKWGGSDVQARTPVAQGYYEPAAVERDTEKNTLRFVMYANWQLSDKAVLAEYTINCESREIVTRPTVGNGNWSAPEPLAAGGKLYPVARELCGWGPGFWKKLAD